MVSARPSFPISLIDLKLALPPQIFINETRLARCQANWHSAATPAPIISAPILENGNR